MIGSRSADHTLPAPYTAYRHYNVSILIIQIAVFSVVHTLVFSKCIPSDSFPIKTHSVSIHVAPGLKMPFAPVHGRSPRIIFSPILRTLLGNDRDVLVAVLAKTISGAASE